MVGVGGAVSAGGVVGVGRGHGAGGLVSVGGAVGCCTALSS